MSPEDSNITSEKKRGRPRKVNEDGTVNRWEDPEWRRKYFREKRREIRGVKRHPNIMSDGRKWSEVHPYGKYETLEEKQQALRESHKKYNAKRPPAPPQRTEKKICPICAKSYYPANEGKHLRGAFHQTAIKTLELHGLTVTKNSFDS